MDYIPNKKKHYKPIEPSSFSLLTKDPNNSFIKVGLHMWEQWKSSVDFGFLGDSLLFTLMNVLYGCKGYFKLFLPVLVVCGEGEAYLILYLLERHWSKAESCIASTFQIAFRNQGSRVPQGQHYQHRVGWRFNSDEF